MNENLNVEFAAMPGKVKCGAAIHFCDTISGRPLDGNERRRLRLAEIEIDGQINRLRQARIEAGLKKSIWHQMDDNLRNRPKLRVDNTYNHGYKIYLYGEIGAKYDGIAAEDFSRELDSIPSNEPVTLHINSEGGSYHDGLAIYQAIADRGNVDVVIDSLAASAGSFIAMGGRTVSISEFGWIMIHHVRGTVQGEAEDLRYYADLFDRHNEKLVEVYSRRWTGSTQALRDAIASETWFDAQQAVTAGLADRTTSVPSVAARVIDPTKFNYASVPTVLQVAARHEQVSPARYRMKFRLLEMEFEESLAN